jgi:nitrile hydratase
VVARLGDWVLPDASVAGLAATEPCYAVRFAAADLFGSGDHTVTVDLWESYLERA